MDIFTALKAAVSEENANGELPDFLVPPLLAVAENPQKYHPKEDLVRRLLAQVQAFDPYAGSGCFSESFSADDIRKTLQELG